MKTLLFATALAALSLTGCTENVRAKAWGGTAKVELAPDMKLLGATWKDAQLWYLVRPMRDDEVAETSTLIEQSSFGIMEGRVVFSETKTKQ